MDVLGASARLVQRHDAIAPQRSSDHHKNNQKNQNPKQQQQRSSAGAADPSASASAAPPPPAAAARARHAGLMPITAASAAQRAAEAQKASDTHM